MHVTLHVRFDKYQEKRGMYFDIRDYLSGSMSENGVIDILKNLSTQKEIAKTVAFRNRYVNFYGEATKKTVDCIAEQII